MVRKRKAELLGGFVRTHRLQRGLSQETVAERAGLHRTYVGLIERGERRATVETMWKIAEALEISFVDLMGEVDRAFKRARD